MFRLSFSQNGKNGATCLWVAALAQGELFRLVSRPWRLSNPMCPWLLSAGEATAPPCETQRTKVYTIIQGWITPILSGRPFLISCGINGTWPLEQEATFAWPVAAAVAGPRHSPTISKKRTSQSDSGSIRSTVSSESAVACTQRRYVS